MRDCPKFLSSIQPITSVQLQAHPTCVSITKSEFRRRLIDVESLALRRHAALCTRDRRSADAPVSGRHSNGSEEATSDQCIISPIVKSHPFAHHVPCHEVRKMALDFRIAGRRQTVSAELKPGALRCCDPRPSARGVENWRFGPWKSATSTVFSSHFRGDSSSFSGSLRKRAPKGRARDGKKSW